VGGAFVARLKGKAWLGLGLGVEDIRKVRLQKCSRDVLTVQYIGLYLGVELNVPTELATTLDGTLNLGCKLNVGFLSPGTTVWNGWIPVPFPAFV
jgi:hypothetical protein